MRVVVLAKQVPDTRTVTKDAMTPEGTVNRAALDAIFNPEDLYALEQALRLKESNGCEVIVLTMGPERATQILKDSLFRGADHVILLSDSRFAGADTLATSYALATAIGKLSPDLVLAGRQAIDGDTAQVGPQIAQELSIPQITYATEISLADNCTIRVKRAIERGSEIVESSLPALVTVTSSAARPRSANARSVMRYKNFTAFEKWSVDTIGGDLNRYGSAGSPTKVRNIENIVFTAKESKVVNPDDASLENLITELIADHTIA